MDEDVAELLQGTAGDPDAIRAKARRGLLLAAFKRCAALCCAALHRAAPLAPCGRPQAAAGCPSTLVAAAHMRSFHTHTQMEARLSNRQMITERAGSEAPPQVRA